MIAKLLILLAIVLKIKSVKILAVFPTPSISHHFVYRPLTAELARLGHEITVITTDPAYTEDNRPTNIKEIDLHNISYDIFNRGYRNAFLEDSGPELRLRIIFLAMTKVVDAQFRRDDIQKLLKEESFDLLIIEAWLRPLLIWSHYHKVPVIKISSLGGTLNDFNQIGSYLHPLENPAVNSYRVFDLPYLEQIKRLYDNKVFKDFYASLEVIENEMLKDIFGDDIPKLEELAGNVDLLFLNVNVLWDVRSVPRNVVYLGGLHQKPASELPEDLKSYLDNSKNGVIYVSFGTNVVHSVLSPHRVDIFVNVLSRLPYDVLWSWERDELPGRGENIRMSKWLPQADLLRHPKIKLFITQGGLQSSDEAITAGVPLIGIPMLGDQWHNVDNYVHHGFGVKLELETLSEGQLRDSIETVIGNPSYRTNIIKFRDIINDSPTSPLHRAAWWTAHSSRLAALPAPPGTRLDAELIAMAATLLITILLVIYTILYYTIRIFVKNIKKFVFLRKFKKL